MSSPWVEKELYLTNTFENYRPLLEQWGKFVDEFIVEELKKYPDFELNDIKIYPKFRVKDKPSFIGKALYRDKQYTNPLLNIEDKVGTRIVLLTTYQVYKVKECLLKQNSVWDSNVGKDIYDLQDNDPNKFDYQAVHIIVTPKASILGFDAETVKYLSCEVQIKTIFQHAFSEISHDTIYKGFFRHDTALVRKIAKSMALMEAADDYFSDAIKMVKDNNVHTLSFLKELSAIFKKLFPQKSIGKEDRFLNSMVIDFINEFGPVDPSRFQKFINNRRDDIDHLVADDSFYLSNQPSVLYLAYMVVHHAHTIHEEWSLSNELLDLLFTKMGYGH